MWKSMSYLEEEEVWDATGNNAEELKVTLRATWTYF